MFHLTYTIMHGNTKLKFYMTVAMETSNPTDEMKKMILTVKLLCRLGTELNHVQFNWSQPCFIAVSDTIVRNVPHLSGLLFQSTTHKTRSFRHLNDRANRVKRHYVKKKAKYKTHFLAALLTSEERKCLDVCSAYPLRQNLWYDVHMTPYPGHNGEN